MFDLMIRNARTRRHASTMGGAMTAIQQAEKLRDAYDEKWIGGNVRKACNLALRYGNRYYGLLRMSARRAVAKG